MNWLDFEELIFPSAGEFFFVLVCRVTTSFPKNKPSSNISLLARLEMRSYFQNSETQLKASALKWPPKLFLLFKPQEIIPPLC